MINISDVNSVGRAHTNRSYNSNVNDPSGNEAKAEWVSVTTEYMRRSLVAAGTVVRIQQNQL